MNKWNKVESTTKIRAYKQIAENTGMADYAVEKDWWVVQTLSIVFDMEIGKSLVFKGGTSLSKAWGLIDRFSEDIDLAVDRNFYGFSGELSKSQRTNLRKTANKYITEIFYPELIERFKAKGFDNVEFEIEDAISKDQDPRIIEIYYPNVIESPGYIKPRIQLEIGSRSLREPFTIQKFSSLLDIHYPNKDFTEQAIKVPTVNPERTLLEKIFLLHEEFQRPKEKIRVSRLSRHLYDIYQLSKTDFAKKILIDKELYETIVIHRHSLTRVGGVNYNLHQPQTVNPIPTPDFINDWKKDYQTMQEQMIYGDSPSFKILIDDIKSFINELNTVKWEMATTFPKPN